MGNAGTTLVLEPGRTFRQVAKNKIEGLASVGHWGERQERFVCNPVFDGDRLYLRGEANLYAIGVTGGQTVRVAGEGSVPDTKAAAKEPAATSAPIREPEEAPSAIMGFRRNGTGIFPAAAPPLTWSEKQNVRWRAAVGHAASSPVVAGDRVVVLSEPGVLVCLRRADGAELWRSALGSPPLGKPSKELARATPVTDGRAVYVTLGDGTVAAFGLDGTRLWSGRVDRPPLSYGASASPVLAGETLLVDGAGLCGMDSARGDLRWLSKAALPHYGTPAVLTLEGRPYAVTAKGFVVRVSDGETHPAPIAEGLGGDQSPSPVVRGDVVYFAYRRCSAVRVALKDGKVVSEKLWEQELPGDVIASPVVAGGMLFVVPAGSPEYRVLDAKTGDVLLEKELDLAPNLYPSLALAGGRLYLGNDEGEMLVLEPGRAYKELARNRLPEGSAASPVFAGGHLFLRGGEFLYCIGP